MIRHLLHLKSKASLIVVRAGEPKGEPTRTQIVVSARSPLRVARGLASGGGQPDRSRCWPRRPMPHVRCGVSIAHDHVQGNRRAWLIVQSYAPARVGRTHPCRQDMCRKMASHLPVQHARCPESARPFGSRERCREAERWRFRVWHLSIALSGAQKFALHGRAALRHARARLDVEGHCHP